MARKVLTINIADSPFPDIQLADCLCKAFNNQLFLCDGVPPERLQAAVDFFTDFARSRIQTKIAEWLARVE